jgi:hypothetical protein
MAPDALMDTVRRLEPADLDVNPADPWRSIVRAQAGRTCRGRASHDGMVEAVVRRVLMRDEVPGVLAAVEAARPWVEASGRAADVWCWALGLEAAMWCAEALAGAEADRNRKAVAMPAGRDAYHAVRGLSGVVGLAGEHPQAPEGLRHLIVEIPDYETQLELKFPDEQRTLFQRLIPLLTTARKRRLARSAGREGGLWRAYLALHELWSSNGHRPAMWSLTEHMKRLQCTGQQIADARARGRYAAEVRALLAARLRMKLPGGKLSAGFPLAVHEWLPDGVWTPEITDAADGRLEYAVIRPGPLYDGVRLPDGQLGSDHMWIPPGLAGEPADVSALYVMLSHQGTWDARRERRETVRWDVELAAQAAFGSQRDPKAKLRAAVARIAALDGAHRIAIEDGYVVFTPPPWATDRAHGIHPLNEPLGVLVEGLPATGAELGEWRKARRLTQAELAGQAGVRRETVARWEALRDGPLPDRARLALQAAGDPAHRPKAKRKAKAKRRPKPRG